MFAISLQRKYYKKSILLVIFFIFISCLFEMIPQNKAKQTKKHVVIKPSYLGILETIEIPGNAKIIGK